MNGVDVVSLEAARAERRRRDAQVRLSVAYEMGKPAISDPLFELSRSFLPWAGVLIKLWMLVLLLGTLAWWWYQV